MSFMVSGENIVVFFKLAYAVMITLHSFISEENNYSFNFYTMNNENFTNTNFKGKAHIYI